MSRHDLRRFVLVLAACVLALAATLKLLAVVTDPMWREVAVIPPTLFLFAAVSELVIAFVLARAAARTNHQSPITNHQSPITNHQSPITNHQSPITNHQSPISAWLLAVCVFAGLWTVAVGLSLTGHQRCDCFGGWAASPIVAVGVDSVLLVLLYACRPLIPLAAFQEAVALFTSRSSSWYGTVTGFGCVLLAVSVISGEPSLYFSLQGKGPPPVRIVGGPTDVGRASPDSLKVAEVKVSNQSAQAVEIIGGGVSCGCMTLNSIPLTIPPRQSVTLQVQIRVPMAAGPFKKSFAYFVRHPGQFRVSGSVQGTVTANAAMAQKD